MVTDEELVALAQHCFQQADRADATQGDCRQLRDIYPAVLQRLREKVEITRHLIEPDRTVIAGPKGREKQAAFADASSDDDQMQLSLLPL